MTDEQPPVDAPIENDDAQPPADDAADAPKSKKNKSKTKVETDEQQPEQIAPPCSLPGVLTFGDQSTAVVALQQRLADAAVLTWRAHTGVYDAMTGQAVQRLQRRCRAAGLYDGPIHGEWDAATRSAACLALR